MTNLEEIKRRAETGNVYSALEDRANLIEIVAQLQRELEVALQLEGEISIQDMVVRGLRDQVAQAHKREAFVMASMVMEGIPYQLHAVQGSLDPVALPAPRSLGKLLEQWSEQRVELERLREQVKALEAAAKIGQRPYVARLEAEVAALRVEQDVSR